MERRKFVVSALSAVAVTYAGHTKASEHRNTDLSLSKSVDNINILLKENKIKKSLNLEPEGEGIPLTDWILGNIRSLFLYLTKDKIDSINAAIPVDVTTELNSAMQDNIPIFIPSGNYIITSSINVGIRSGLIGAGAKSVLIDNRSSDHAFIFPVGYDRGTKDFLGFSIESSIGTAKDKYAFYLSSAADGRLNYSVGWRFVGIEINGQGMGGGWYLQDCFRVTIRDCGASSLSNPFYLAGSVVQLTVDNFVNNGDNQPKTNIGSYGVYMTTKKYSDENGIKMPEGITFINCKFVKQEVGAHALGLYVQFVNTEFDYSSKFGGFYAGGDKVDFINCYVGTTHVRNNDFVAFMVQTHASKVPEPVLISNCTINMQKNSSDGYKSYGVILSGEKDFISGAKVVDCFFRGDGYENCILVKRVDGVIIDHNTFKVRGENVKVESAKNITISNNFALGNYSLPNPEPDYCWIITGNTGDFSDVDLSEAKKSLIVNQGLMRN